jgi:hypothetical protein
MICRFTEGFDIIGRHLGQVDAVSIGKGMLGDELAVIE